MPKELYRSQHKKFIDYVDGGDYREIFALSYLVKIDIMLLELWHPSALLCFLVDYENL